MITNKENVCLRFPDHMEIAVVKNPSYVFPPEDFYPLAPRISELDEIKAVLTDMDGTTTTTEELCIYSLEQMVRRASGKTDKLDWKGLDETWDYPNIIGNSTTNHVEYLLRTYKSLVKPDCLKKEFLLAAHWTLTKGMDPIRRREVEENLAICGLKEAVGDIEAGITEKSLLEKYTERLPNPGFNEQVAWGIDIYYQEYHQILKRLSEGESKSVKQQVFGTELSTKNLIAPMPGMPIFIPLIKGWLGPDVRLLLPELLGHISEDELELFGTREEIENRLVKLAENFVKHPASLALVTSSVFYEAKIVITELLRVMSEFIAGTPLPESKKSFILQQFSSYRHVYDAFVTATDSSEIRLKPHRDLYSIALRKIGLPPVDFDKVIGFEDSQSGTLAIRAAGVGCCIALPFEGTKNHKLEAAVDIPKWGIPEVLLGKGLYLKSFKKS